MTFRAWRRRWLAVLAMAAWLGWMTAGMAAVPEPNATNGTVVKVMVGESLTIKADGGGEETFFLPPKQQPDGRWPQGGINRADISMRSNHIQPGMKVTVKWLAAASGRKEIAELLGTGTVTGMVVTNLCVAGRVLAVKVDGLERPMRFFCHYVAPPPGSGSTSWVPDPKDSELIATPLGGAQVRVDYELRGTLLVKGLSILKQGAVELPKPPPGPTPPVARPPEKPVDPPELQGVAVPPPPPPLPE